MLNVITLLVLLMAPTSSQSRVILASWYDRGHHTASGEKFNPDLLTAAHKSLKFGTKVRLRYKERTVTVRINDRGPFTKNRSLDLSRGAAKALDFRKSGIDKIEILAIIDPVFPHKN